MPTTPDDTAPANAAAEPAATPPEPRAGGASGARERPPRSSPRSRGSSNGQYGTLWIGGSPRADLASAQVLLDASERLIVSTGVVNIWTAPAAETAASFHRIEARHPGRFVLGIGIGHRESIGDRFEKPYAALVRYLDELDAHGCPCIAG